MRARRIHADLVAIIESVYDIERDAHAWIAGILERLEPSVADGTGLYGFEYAITKAGLQVSSFTSRGCADEMSGELSTWAVQREPEWCVVASELPHCSGSGGGEHARAAAILDNWCIVGRSPDSRGLAVIVNRRVRGAPPATLRAALARVATHFAAAHRFRARLQPVRNGSFACDTVGDPVSEESGPAGILSPRERQVLSQALGGRSNKEIASELAIGHSTVRVLFTRATRKLGARDRCDLLRRFEALGAVVSK